MLSGQRHGIISARRIDNTSHKAPSTQHPGSGSRRPLDRLPPLTHL